MMLILYMLLWWLWLLLLLLSITILINMIILMLLLLPSVRLSFCPYPLLSLLSLWSSSSWPSSSFIILVLVLLVVVVVVIIITLSIDYLLSSLWVFFLVLTHVALNPATYVSGLTLSDETNVREYWYMTDVWWFSYICSQCWKITSSFAH